MLSYVFNAASSYVRYPSSSVASGSDQPTSPTDLSKTRINSTNPFIGPLPASSSSSSASSSSSKSWDSPSSSRSSTPASSTCSSPTSTPSKAPNSRSGTTSTPSSSEKYAVIHAVLRHENLYDVLGVPHRTSDVHVLRRAYMSRCKSCHPDKFPEYPLATLAFQKVSFAYDTLSHVSSRRAYDTKGFAGQFSTSTSDNNGNYYAHRAPDDTLNAVLYGVFCDFMDGDFEMIRTFIRAMGEINPAMNMGDETLENLVSTFRRLREVLLAGQKYVRIIRFELIRMHEIQTNLRQLSYFDVCGRLRLTLQLARVTLSLPMVVDLAMRDESSDDSDEDEDEKPKGLANTTNRPRVRMDNARRKRKGGLLHPRVSSIIGLAVGALEMGERVL